MKTPISPADQRIRTLTWQRALLLLVGLGFMGSSMYFKVALEDEKKLRMAYQEQVLVHGIQAHREGYKDSFLDTLNNRNHYSVQLQEDGKAVIWERAETIDTPAFAAEVAEQKKADLAGSVLIPRKR